MWVHILPDLLRNDKAPRGLLWVRVFRLARGCGLSIALAASCAFAAQAPVKGKAKPVHTNRLIHEKSPYLLQHAHNPVDWYAWGTEAFEKARKEDKPIFV
jgi:Protein of unknown function, DUF255